MYFQSVNGIEIDQISTFDRGLAYGDGLFTTAKIVNGSVLILEQHIERLRHGCKTLNITYWPNVGLNDLHMTLR